MTVRLVRTAATRSPWTLGVEVSDGLARSWQTSGNRVGRFARALSTKERSTLRRALDAAAGAEESAAPAATPHQVVDQLAGDGIPDLVLAGAASAPAPYRRLVRFLRALREDLATSPVAAIALEVAGSPLGARLT